MTQDELSLGSLAIEPTPALGQHVVDELRRLIITGRLSAETHLVEKQLSQTFDVSRGPIRDALRQLELEGLVESRRRGVFIIGLTAADLAELYGLRQLLEAEAVRLCIASPKLDPSAAREALDRMQTAAEAGDPAAFAHADLEFHSSFYVQAQHRRLASVWQQYRPTFAGMLAVTNTVDRDLQPTFDDHVTLLEAITDRSEQDALPLLREHIDGSHRRMLEAYANFLTTH